MSPTTEQLLNAALALPAEERLELVEALAASLQTTDRPPFDESWRAIIQRRSTELRRGEIVSVSWEEVKRKARENAGAT
jgi:putative addiction module component (TIGR02574 family)